MNWAGPFHREQNKDEIRETRELPELRGPLTAREALNAILPAVREIDRAFQLTFVGSGGRVSALHATVEVVSC